MRQGRAKAQKWQRRPSDDISIQETRSHKEGKTSAHGNIATHACKLAHLFHISVLQVCVLPCTEVWPSIQEHVSWIKISSDSRRCHFCAPPRPCHIVTKWTAASFVIQFTARSWDDRQNIHLPSTVQWCHVVDKGACKCCSFSLQSLEILTIYSGFNGIQLCCWNCIQRVSQCTHCWHKKRQLFTRVVCSSWHSYAPFRTCPTNNLNEAIRTVANFSKSHSNALERLTAFWRMTQLDLFITAIQLALRHPRKHAPISNNLLYIQTEDFKPSPWFVCTSSMAYHWFLDANN